MKVPLVLLSGLLSNALLWDHQIRHLSDIAAIQRIASTQNTPQKMVEAILDQAPPKFALAGHSMGGWLCLEILRAAPSRVSKLCLLNTTSRMDSVEKRKAREQTVLKVKRGQFKEVAKWLSDRFVFNSLVKPDVEKMFLEVGAEAFINQEESMLQREESRSILSGITCPTLIVHAAQDEVFSFAEQQELVHWIPGAKLAIVEDAGHMSPMEMPQAVTALFRFWLTYLT